MDAHLFRRLCREYVPALVGTRIEKIYQPAESAVMLTLYGSGRSSARAYEEGSRIYAFFDPTGACSASEGEKRYLILKSGRKDPLLFLAEHRVTVGAQPPAFIMLLRKHLSQRRIVRVYADWIARVLYMQVQDGACLALDVKNGPRLITDIPGYPEMPERFSEDAKRSSWSESVAHGDATMLERCAGMTPPADSLWDIRPGEQMAADLSDRRDKTVLTPLLRRTLACMDRSEADALLRDLECGDGDVFVYESPAGRLASAFPLVHDAGVTEKIYENVLDALAFTGETVFAGMSAEARAKAAKPFTAEIKRLDRLLDKLSRERDRLAAMAGKKDDALALQAELYRFDREDKQDSVNAGGRTVKLDPKYTVRENMSRLFHQASRGDRGLEILEERFRSVRKQREEAEMERERQLAARSGLGFEQEREKRADSGSGAPAHQGRGGHGAVNKGARNAVAASAAARKRESERGRKRPKADLSSDVQAFRSSDGFLLLRGRSAKGNAAVLKMAAPYDYWLHTAEGPSAHVIVRRDHAAQEVPESTMSEAGILAALKSPYKESGKALIQYSLAKYISPMRNAPKGMVRIDKSEGAFAVRPDPELEEKLSV
ncbi:MAG: DUF814 domain-containing protein [Mailhella sp.]|nr:DUF814 domain-containing protein [Mailhella sp.]